MLPRPFSCKEKNQSSSSPSSAGASAWRRNSVSDFDSVERMAVVVMRRPPSAKGRDALPSRVSRPAWSGKLQRKRTEARYCWTKSVYRARTASSRSVSYTHLTLPTKARLWCCGLWGGEEN